jgi:hypothetical protein
MYKMTILGFSVFSYVYVAIGLYVCFFPFSIPVCRFPCLKLENIYEFFLNIKFLCAIIAGVHATIMQSWEI